MFKMVYRRIVALSFLVLLVLGLSFSGSRSSVAAPPDPQVQSMAGPNVLVRASYASRATRALPPPELALDGKTGATINVNYIGTWSTEAQSAFQYAVDIWASQINSPVAIEVDASWESLDPGILGAARASNIYANFTNAPVANTWYAVAMANALYGSDLNGANPEIEARFNKDFTGWYLGTDGNTPFDKWDFVSVVLHELCHGLGFFGSMQVSGGLGYWGYYSTGGNLYPVIYDRFAETGDGQALIGYANGSSTLATHLQGGNIFFDGPYANASNGGSRVELYAPGTWWPGSSYSHVDETFNGTPNDLMTYSISNGEANHLPGPVVMGMFEDMGWFSPHMQIAGRVAGGAAQSAGDAVTYTLSIVNDGTSIASGVVITDQLPAAIVAPYSWTVSPSLSGTTARAGAPYVWDLPDLVPAATGVITIYGTLDPSLSTYDVIVNQADIAVAEVEADLSDNSTYMTIIIDPLQTFLPLALK